MNSAEQVASPDVVAQVRAELCASAEDIRRKLIRSCINKGLSFEDSEDVAQTVFCVAYSSANKFRRESSLESWIWGILRFMVYTQIQKICRERAAYSDIEPTTGSHSNEHREIEDKHDVDKLLSAVSVSPRQLHALGVMMRDGKIRRVEHATACAAGEAIRKMRSKLNRSRRKRSAK